MSNPIFHIKNSGYDQKIDYRPGHKYLIVWRIDDRYAIDEESREDLRAQLTESYIFLGMAENDFKIIFAAGKFEPLATIEVVQ